ncbi:2Fe-2S iron-sulfur cluster binding domain-containing protein (plasmid) [Rhodococcus sp. ZPP]|uniref:2Fe-2S iron-sulfur cluster binding domain-containing protein n=2 Tax=Rhodococcus TaxID=1827 RepID=UPI001AD85A92|nr:2Fe-2S iron-sulfur cluster binding domain-containing protein [Rhodococcus erythropolis]MBO8150779.1 2Fe-2S iron-sulfur cluster binding domain-containing protein [Rhodococcus erythropolis]QTJ70954.1 2Fe-2S iron-sulfur cluster binding domain-containing protein [Rhodococcus sp. ZPP]
MTHQVKMFFEDDGEAEISCGEDEDVVTAALRQGVLLMTECREGVCSTCKCYLAEGDYSDLLSHSVHALSPAEEEEGFVLACRLKPASDLELEFDYPYSLVQHFEASTWKASIEDIRWMSETTVSLTVRTLAAQEPVNFTPGQFVRLTLSNGISRDFSMCHLPRGDRLLSFQIKVYPDGQFSSYIGSKAQVGDPITVEGPMGKFVYRDTGRIPVFIAGGTGLAPIIAMLRALEETSPSQEAILFFGNTNPGDVYYTDELKELCTSLPNLKVSFSLLRPDSTWGGEVGLVTESLARYISPRAPSYEYYFCGAPVMIDAVTRILEELGVPRNQRHNEDFVPSKKEAE